MDRRLKVDKNLETNKSLGKDVDSVSEVSFSACDFDIDKDMAKREKNKTD
jgi:hypothetical protein